MNKGFKLIYLILAVVIIGMGGKFYIGDLEKDKEVEAVVPDPDLGEDSTAEEDLEEVVYKYTTANLNLRKGPSTQEDIILTIPRGQRVEVLESEKGWDKLKYNETIGYSSNEYLLEEQLKEEMGQVEATEGLTIINGILLVNKEYGLPMGYDPGPDPVAKEYLDKMIEACYEETGKKLIAFSGYRTYEYQKGLFDRYVEKDGYENAVLYSAKPRHSEHESGLAYDIGGSDQAYWLEEEFENTEEGIWLKKNSHRFGYILRYPKDKTHITGYIYEPWHFRYVGIEHATNIYERDITLEEYLQVYK